MINLTIVFITALATSEARQQDYPTPCSPLKEYPARRNLCMKPTSQCDDRTGRGCARQTWELIPVKTMCAEREPSGYWIWREGQGCVPRFPPCMTDRDCHEGEVCRAQNYGDPLGCYPSTSTTAGTIELGIFTDKYLWNNLKRQVRGTDEEVEERMQAIVYKAVDSAQKLMMLDSISERGGFKLVIKNITIWKDQDDKDPRIRKISNVVDRSMKNNNLFDAVVDYSNEANVKKGGGQFKYDMMIFLINTDQMGGTVGKALLGTFCSPSSTILVKVQLEDGDDRASEFTGNVIAHEMGHVLGSNHDGDEYKISEDDSGTTVGVCYNSVDDVMHPYTSDAINWSSCSRTQIDNLLSRLESEKGVCFQ